MCRSAVEALAREVKCRRPGFRKKLLHDRVSSFTCRQSVLQTLWPSVGDQGESSEAGPRSCAKSVCDVFEVFWSECARDLD